MRFPLRDVTYATLPSELSPCTSFSPAFLNPSPGPHEAQVRIARCLDMKTVDADRL